MALAPDLRTRLNRELLPGERLVWSQQPRGDRLYGAFAIWLFAIPWTVFALFWESMALMPWIAATHTPPGIAWTFGIVMPLFGLPFITAGLWMLWQPFRAIRKATDTIYALTDRRAIRLVAGRTSEQVSVFLDRIGPIEKRESADGWGSLRIQTHSRIDSDGDRQTERFEILGVPDVARLHRLILERQPG